MQLEVSTFFLINNSLSIAVIPKKLQLVNNVCSKRHSYANKATIWHITGSLIWPTFLELTRQTNVTLIDESCPITRSLPASP